MYCLQESMVVVEYSIYCFWRGYGLAVMTHGFQPNKFLIHSNILHVFAWVLGALQTYSFFYRVWHYNFIIFVLGMVQNNPIAQGIPNEQVTNIW